jgi:hypothetical protein
MNTMLNNGLKAVSCGAAAIAITLVSSLSFIQSTAEVHNTTPTRSAWMAKVAVQTHAGFGQSQPAVLVD